MAVEAVARTDTGLQREHNEDAVLVKSTAGGQLLAVADGMGGHNAGEVASETALNSFAGVLEGAPEGSATSEALEQAVMRADSAVRTKAEEDAEREGMGTTLVAALVTDDRATVVNVGDSRAYRVTDATVEQITVDHSLVQELVESGEITEQEAEVHPRRNVISQALGASDAVEPDSFSRELASGETLVLCSDGLTEEVEESTLGDVVASADSLDRAASELIELANENGGSDNISVALCRRD
ncbi:Stp1/IreP family PP2C-type Ser/Thr phosphatase [Halobacteriales archaeon QH_10_67_22]|nr:MAG: Stp1/IreP family PP2C-type Ser/Thr phosphatase [Halobacteriales archaeon QH_10_67_22]